MKQRSLFDPDDGERRREEAIDRVEKNADDAWKQAAHEAVMRLARAGRRFTTDDVWAAMPPVEATHEPRAMGAIMRAAKSQGIVHPLQEWRLSQRPECHRRPLRVWVAAGPSGQ